MWPTPVRLHCRHPQATLQCAFLGFDKGGRCHDALELLQQWPSMHSTESPFAGAKIPQAPWTSAKNHVFVQTDISLGPASTWEPASLLVPDEQKMDTADMMVAAVDNLDRKAAKGEEEAKFEAEEKLETEQKLEAQGGEAKENVTIKVKEEEDKSQAEELTPPLCSPTEPAHTPTKSPSPEAPTALGDITPEVLERYKVKRELEDASHEVESLQGFSKGVFRRFKQWVFSYRGFFLPVMSDSCTTLVSQNSNLRAQCKMLGAELCFSATFKKMM